MLPQASLSVCFIPCYATLRFQAHVDIHLKQGRCSYNNIPSSFPTSSSTLASDAASPLGRAAFKRVLNLKGAAQCSDPSPGSFCITLTYRFPDWHTEKRDLVAYSPYRGCDLQLICTVL